MSAGRATAAFSREADPSIKNKVPVAESRAEEEARRCGVPSAVAAVGGGVVGGVWAARNRGYGNQASVALRPPACARATAHDSVRDVVADYVRL